MHSHEFVRLHHAVCDGGVRSNREKMISQASPPPGTRVTRPLSSYGATALGPFPLLPSSQRPQPLLLLLRRNFRRMPPKPLSIGAVPACVYDPDALGEITPIIATRSCGQLSPSGSFPLIHA